MRIVAVSDVFQALAQRRPYRKPLGPDEILDLLRSFVRQNHLDSEIVELAGRHLQASWQAATGLKSSEESLASSAIPV
jgi:HD-GYP domain-containing protein (c-di-GMP phosphodiesterase class II)